MLDALWCSLSYLYIQCNSLKLIVCIVVLWQIQRKCIHFLIKHDCSHPCLLDNWRHSIKPWGGMCIMSAVTHVSVCMFLLPYSLISLFYITHLQWHVSLSVERLQGVLPRLWTWKKCMAERLLHCYDNPNHAGSQDVLSQPSVSLTDKHILLSIWDEILSLTLKQHPSIARASHVMCQKRVTSPQSSVISDKLI